MEIKVKVRVKVKVMVKTLMMTCRWVYGGQGQGSCNDEF